jgi:DNA-binding beta-propeller fold protein YncE
MKRILSILIATIFVTGCATRSPMPISAIELDDVYTSPVAMTVGPDGKIYLAVNNAGIDFKFQQSGRIARITMDNKIEDVIPLRRHPNTKIASPMGLDFAKDGNLYIADDQSLATDDPQSSRLLRVIMKDGLAVNCEVVATGFNKPRGVACEGDSVYVCDGALDKGHPLPSGVYRFRISELNARKPVAVTGMKDEHLILKLKTRNREHATGASGLCFDSTGNMYVSNFGDREVYKVTFTHSGRVRTARPFVRCRRMASAAGIHADENDDLWLADMLGNTVVKIDSQSRKVTTIASNDPGDGEGGTLDAPSDCIRRGHNVYVANSDLTYGPNTADELNTISIIGIK